MSEETVDNVRFSLGRFDRYLSQLRRQLQWFSAESSESRESRRIPKCLEAISLPQVISASELPMPKAISELVAELITGLTGFDSLEKEEGQLEVLRHLSASLAMIDKMLGLPLPPRRMSPRRRPRPSQPARSKRDGHLAEGEKGQPRRENRGQEEKSNSAEDFLVVEDLLLVEESDAPTRDQSRPVKEDRPEKGSRNGRSSGERNPRWYLDSSSALTEFGFSEDEIKALEMAGCITVGDLLLKRPIAYEVFKPIVGAGRQSEPARIAVSGRVLSWSTRISPSQEQHFELIVKGAGLISVRWAGNVDCWFIDRWTPNSKVVLVGEYDGTCLLNAEFAIDDGKHKVQLAQYGIEGIEDWKLRAVIQRISPDLQALRDPIPEMMLRHAGQGSLGESLLAVHLKGSKSAAKRLAFDEALMVQLGLSLRQTAESDTKRTAKGRKHTIVHKSVARLLQYLGVELSDSQAKVFEQIKRDLTKKEPMKRLMIGEAGLGRWLISLATMAMVTQDKQQVVYVAPNELTARTRLALSIGVFEAMGVSAVRVSEAPSAQILEEVKSGSTKVVFTTLKSLEAAGVSFKKLGLVVAEDDSNHGATLNYFSNHGTVEPDQLLFSTDIVTPAELLVGYSNVYISRLKGGDSEVSCSVFSAKGRDEAYRRLAERSKGRQAIIVLPMVSGSDALGIHDALGLASSLEQGLFDGLSVKVLHGSMSEQETKETFEAFRKHEFEVLIATSIFEVGRHLPGVETVLLEQADCIPTWRTRRILGYLRDTRASVFFVTGDPASEEGNVVIEKLVKSDDVYKTLETCAIGGATSEQIALLPKLEWLNLEDSQDLLITTRTEVRDLVGGRAPFSGRGHGSIADTLRSRWDRYFQGDCLVPEVKQKPDRKRRRRRR